MARPRYNNKALKLRLMAGEYIPRIHEHIRASYLIAAILSHPLWVKNSDLQPVYDEAVRLTKETGIPHEVDHDIPINHTKVSGLSVPWNLRILSQFKNGQKGNAWSEEHFEQSSLF